MIVQQNSDQGLRRTRKSTMQMIGILTCLLILTSWNTQANAMRSPAPERIPAIMIGDRVVDIAYNLQVMPVAMSVRGSLWPMADKLKTTSQIIGCPNRVTVVSKKTVPEALKRYGVNRLIVEKHDDFCVYKSKVKPENIMVLVEGMDVQIDVVDFSQGLEPAIIRMGQLLGREQQAETLVKTYRESLEKMKADLPAQPLGKNIVVVNGVLQAETGKVFLRVEAPGGYSDKFLLEPLGCSNIGDVLIGDKTVDKGHATIRSLSKLAELQADAIVITGDSSAVQRALHQAVQEHPELAEIKALRNHAVFSLPAYFDSSVIEYPLIFAHWANALAEI